MTLIIKNLITVLDHQEITDFATLVDQTSSDANFLEWLFGDRKVDGKITLAEIEHFERQFPTLKPQIDLLRSLLEPTKIEYNGDDRNLSLFKPIRPENEKISKKPLEVLLADTSNLQVFSQTDENQKTFLKIQTQPNAIVSVTARDSRRSEYYTKPNDVVHFFPSDANGIVQMTEPIKTDGAYLYDIVVRDHDLNRITEHVIGIDMAGAGLSDDRDVYTGPVDHADWASKTSPFFGFKGLSGGRW